MALLPSVPTSFVPHSPSATPAGRARAESSGVLGFIAYGVLLIAFIMAIGVFAYGQILKNQQAAKDQQLAKAEQALDPTTVQGFLRLQHRLTYSKQELASHVAFSNFFTALGAVLPTTVRLSMLHLAIDQSGQATLDGAGVAKSFNALASLSNALAQDGRFKSAIFSKISIKPDSTVSFGISAIIDPKLIAFNPSASAAPTQTASTSVQMVNPTPPPSPAGQAPPTPKH